MLNFFRKRHLTAEQEEALVAAIGAAEEGNRGEVRVHLEARCKSKEGALARAQEKFYALGMDDTEEGTGVLLYVAIKDRVTAVYAGPVVHQCGTDEFWQDVTDSVAKGFADGDPTSGLVAAVEHIGDLLREHVPGEDVAGNELPNEVSMA